MAKKNNRHEMSSKEKLIQTIVVYALWICFIIFEVVDCCNHMHPADF